MKAQRVCIYAKEASIILGISIRQACRVLQKIKKEYNKENHQVVTFEEFANYIGVDQQIIRERLF